jgi:ATP-dependent helicase/nuclease subunit B
MGRVLTRTVLTLQNHLKKGTFTPEQYEMSFQYADKLESIHVTLSQQEKMHLQGRIDRIDVAEDDEHVYVKVIDYKSGNKQFDLAALYYGLQLQLVVYLNAAVEMEAEKHPDKEIVPAALLYYHVDDPTVETAVELSEEELDQEILGKLRMNGVVNAEPDIVERLDRYLQDKSDVIPVEKKKDGTFSARSSVMTREELQAVSDFVNKKVKINTNITIGVKITSNTNIKLLFKKVKKIEFNLLITPILSFFVAKICVFFNFSIFLQLQLITLFFYIILIYI